MGRSRRTLPEELLLLALDPATGTTAQPQSLDLGLAGAQLVELALAGRIAPDGDRIAVVVPRPTGDPTLDSALELLRRRGAPVRAVHWIGGPRLGLRQTYLSHLERCGMVHAVAGQMCGVLPTTRYQATDTEISREIRARLDSAIRTGVPPDPRTAALAALAHAVGLGKHLYPGNEGRSSRSRLRDLIRHDPMGGLVAHAVMDVQNGVAAQPRRSSAPAGGRPPAAGAHRNPHAASRRSHTADPWHAPPPTDPVTGAAVRAGRREHTGSLRPARRARGAVAWRVPVVYPPFPSGSTHVGGSLLIEQTQKVARTKSQFSQYTVQVQVRGTQPEVHVPWRPMSIPPCGGAGSARSCAGSVS